MRPIGLGGMVFLALLGLARPARAATPVPPFPADGVLAVAGAAAQNDYGALRTFLLTHRSPVGARYHALIVDYSDPLDRDGPDYGDESGRFIDDVVERWAPRVDRQSAVLVVLALRNRDIIVHPFSRWVELGWEASEVVETIDRSPFATHARAGDYAEALRQLVLAIDGELAARIRRRDEETAERFRRRDEQLAYARTTAAAVRARVAAWDQRAAEASLRLQNARPVRDLALGEAAEAERLAAIGHAALAAEKATAAQANVSSAERLLAEAEAQVAWVRAQIPLLRQRLATIDAELAAEPFLESARDHALQGRRELARAEAELALGEPGAAYEAVRGTYARVAQAEATRDVERAEHRFWTRTVPIALAGVLSAALLALFVLRLWASRRKRAEAQKLVGELEQLIGRASANLLALQNEHPLVLGRPDLVEHFRGETAPHVREAARRVDDLFLALDVAQRLAKDGRAVLAGEGLFSALRVESFARVVRALTVDEVVARTEDVRPRRLFLPEEREVRMSPPALLHEMSAAYDDAIRLVTLLETRFIATWGALDRARGDLAAVEAANAVAWSHGIVAVSIVGERDRLAAALADVATRAERDPIGCEPDVATDGGAAAALRTRAERIAASLTRIGEEVVPRVARIEARIAALRAEGMHLSEPGFEPEVAIAHVERAVTDARGAAADAQDERAEAEASEALESARELEELVERSVVSRTETAPGIERERARTEALRARLPERRERLEGLARAHADSALQPALDNADEAAGVLGRATDCLDEASRFVTPDVQRYLAGAELLARAIADLDAVEALYTEIEEKAAALAASRARAEGSWGACDALEAELARMTAEGDTFASAATLEERRRVPEALAVTRAAAEAARPDWIAVERESAKLLEDAQHLVARAQRELEAWREVQRMLRQLDAEKQRFAQQLASSGDDLPETNRAFSVACAALEDAAAMAARPRPEWPEVLSAVQAAAQQLRESEQMANRDFEEAREARAAVARAAESIRACDRSYGYGVVASLGPSRNASDEAMRLLSQGRYRDALRAAQEAARAAEGAQREAQRRVDEARAAERRRREAAEAAARARARASRSSIGSSSRSSSFGSSSRSSSSGSSSRSSSSGSGSRSSSSRPSGSSGFGSSSGRSSFGRSSGRSKW
ncbi:MAG: hypothetical protein IT379_40885 [Deltaproteobacteria bacterium]|nr:hypothetical protein [Deltaproteobacteria bacterium]